ncbi:MAG: sigma 54-interacting transcriptional regulator [Nannocystaceae bacterium]|nr:sigma 54-interacting transcriptional regulator [Nannocystaceae bacterium]
MTDAPLHTQQIGSGQGITALRRRRLRLDVIKGPNKKTRVDLEGDRIVVGTHETCDLVLTDPTVSRQHFEIELVTGGYAIRDLDSLNGTFIDSLRIRDVVVPRNTTITIGETRIKMAPQDDTVDLPLSSETRCGPLVGRSPEMRRVFDLIRKVAPADATVLITGESGTGKELAARALHDLSNRCDAPFVVVDCAALPPTLIESELYGHERGAFTGAEKSRIGAFEAADGGTVFLDEIGELPVDLQTRLLGVIERRQVQPLGSAKTRKINVRLIAATNRDLRREVNRETFRSDLYFRLAVVGLHMPALRDRPDDIPLYIDAFLADQTAAGFAFSIDPDTIVALKLRPWPGNVRELRNTLERAAALGEIDAAMSDSEAAQPQDPTLPDGPSDGLVREFAAKADPAVPFKTGKALLVGTYEQAYIESLMKKHNNNITRAARGAEIDRVYLLRLLDKYDMRPSKRGKVKRTT